MPRSVSSYFTSSPLQGEQIASEEGGSRTAPQTAPPSPSATRRGYGLLPEPYTGYQSLEPPIEAGETTGLLGKAQPSERGVPSRSYTTFSASSGPEPGFRHTIWASSLRRSRHHSRTNSQSKRFHEPDSMDTPRVESSTPSTKHPMTASFMDDRTWYDQFTSTDWVHDSVADGARLRELRARKDTRGRLLALFDGAQGWILVAVIGCITAAIAYFVDVTEEFVFSLKGGVCTTRWLHSRQTCCVDARDCPAWRSWSEMMNRQGAGNQWVDFAVFVTWAVALAVISCVLTLLTKTVVPSSVSLTTLDENLGAGWSRGSKRTTGVDASPASESSGNLSRYPTIPTRPDMVYYSAAGSGVAEVKVINSGFVLHGYLGFKTLVIKTIALVFSVASGLSLGKEGPYVHIATCVGNICCRMFSKYNLNDGKRREVLSASAASGVAVAFGAPIGGVLFSLEEVSYYFPPKTLFRTFFCCIAAALSLKFLNPYGTGKIVLFEVRYLEDWEIFELIIFMFLGVLGGAVGALFIKASSLWARSFRRIPIIKRWPLFEVILVALLTGLVSFWNRYTKLPVTELLLELASPCESSSSDGLCPHPDGIGEVIRSLTVAFVIKSLLTVVTFGIKLPAGIYVPSMVVGGLMGRIVGHMTQYLVLQYPDFFLFRSSCPAIAGIESCVTPGVYAMVAAGATMCGVTRLSVTLAVILFELTGSLDHVLPFSLAVLCAKWTADAIEPHSIYDSLTEMNSYPFLDNKLQPMSDAQLGDIVRPVRRSRLIDITESSLVPARELRSKLQHLLMAGELDSGLPILRDGILMGLIPAPDLEYALDNLDDEENTLCLMAMDTSSVVSEGEGDSPTEVDFTRYIDPAPLSLDIHSPINLVYQCFVKLGLRYLCVLRDGQYAGLVHKKAFVKFMKDHE
ncbi:hypothetical protein ARAM_006908 [Aspergillus rambellii]|uniref:Voltage-gated chloride channel (ClcA) n=1 Tax=Aspergillus rambellii TaxID=308745 RepID=A0A0F8WRW9_9EURO|nr:hypothetical protein ARAM_006908 [Aspergillus rambellii]